MELSIINSLKKVQKYTNNENITFTDYFNSLNILVLWGISVVRHTNHLKATERFESFVS